MEEKEEGLATIHKYQRLTLVGGITVLGKYSMKKGYWVDMKNRRLPLVVRFTSVWRDGE